MTSQLRQLGDQEVDILRMAGDHEVRGADHRSRAGRRDDGPRHSLRDSAAGPPIHAPIDAPGFQSRGVSGVPAASDPTRSPTRDAALRLTCGEILEKLAQASRPVILIGSGVRLAGALDDLRRTAELLNVPVATAWTAIDALEAEHSLYCGRPGTIGDRAGNFAVQNSDFLLVIGCRLNIRQVSYNWRAFARHAYKVQVDVDPCELEKPTVRPDLPVEADAKDFLVLLREEAAKRRFDGSAFAGWIHRCRERVARYPVVLDRHRAFRAGFNRTTSSSSSSPSSTRPTWWSAGNGSACVVTSGGSNPARPAGSSATPATLRWATTFRPRSAPPLRVVGGASSAWPATAACR